MPAYAKGNTDHLAEARTLLRTTGQRLTKPRLATMATLLKHERALSHAISGN